MEIKKTRDGVCIDGFRAYGTKRQKYGVAIILAEQVCECAAVFTRNSVQAGCITHNKKNLKNGVQAVVVNSGNANCFTPHEFDDAVEMAQEAARVLNISPGNVAVGSTGVIGRRLEVKTVSELITETAVNLSSGPKGSIQAAKAIMTTDTTIKMYSAKLNGIRVGGIAKGAGMIAPNMATMLCYMTTDADIPKAELKRALRDAVGESFNMISVDGDMSTNDTVMILSNKTKKCNVKDFRRLLGHVCVELAMMVARDGEGATKFIEATVGGAKRKEDAVKAVKAIINSPLIKAAVYGENPNWGRIVMALGSVMRFDRERLKIMFESGGRSVTAVKGGRPQNLESARRVLSRRNVRIRVELGLGSETATGWGCDLTPEYVKINAEYN
jgi:glutamate N-acetyltransferase / amino-acid N-acetyltransferase